MPGWMVLLGIFAPRDSGSQAAFIWGLHHPVPLRSLKRHPSNWQEGKMLRTTTNYLTSSDVLLLLMVHHPELIIRTIELPGRSGLGDERTGHCARQLQPCEHWSYLGTMVCMVVGAHFQFPKYHQSPSIDQAIVFSLICSVWMAVFLSSLFHSISVFSMSMPRCLNDSIFIVSSYLL